MKRIVALALSFALLCGRNLAADPSAETRQWAATCKTPPPARYVEAVDRLIGRMKEEQLWDKCGLLLFFAAHEGDSAAFNLKGAAVSKLVGGAEHQPGRAIKGNGTDASV